MLYRNIIVLLLNLKYFIDMIARINNVYLTVIKKIPKINDTRYTMNKTFTFV